MAEFRWWMFTMSAKAFCILYTGYLVPAVAILPLLLASFRYRSLSAELKVIVWYLALSIVSSIITNGMAQMNSNNLPVIHVYTLCEWLVLACFYSKLFCSPSVKRIIGITVVLYFVFFLLDIAFLEPINQFNNYSKSIESILVVVCSFTYFIRLMDDTPGNVIFYPALAFINAGLLIYFSSSFILFVLLNVNPRFLSAHIMMWNIHATFLLVMFILFSIGLWKYKP